MKISMAFWTHYTQVTIGFRIPFYLPKPPILDECNDPAPVPAPVAKSRNLCNGCLCARMSPSLEVEKLIPQGKGPYRRSRRFQKTPPRYLKIFKTHRLMLPHLLWIV